MVEGKLLELKKHLREIKATTGGGRQTKLQLDEAGNLVDVALAEHYEMQKTISQYFKVERQIEDATEAMRKLTQDISNK